jgi:hypothetical protein
MVAISSRIFSLHQPSIADEIARLVKFAIEFHPALADCASYDEERSSESRLVHLGIDLNDIYVEFHPAPGRMWRQFGQMDTHCHLYMVVIAPEGDIDSTKQFADDFVAHLGSAHSGILQHDPENIRRAVARSIEQTPTG